MLSLNTQQKMTKIRTSLSLNGRYDMDWSGPDRQMEESFMRRRRANIRCKPQPKLDHSLQMRLNLEQRQRQDAAGRQVVLCGESSDRKMSKS